MTNREVAAAFTRGECAFTRTLRSEPLADGVRLMSYDEPIAVLTDRLYVLPDDVARGYSQTTTRHYGLMLDALAFAAHNGSWGNLDVIAHDVVRVSREGLREMANVPATPPRVRRVGHSTHRTSTGSQVHMGESA